jgi:hypothetical protein
MHPVKAIIVGLKSLAHLGVGVTQFDSDVSLQLVLESDGLNTRDSSDGR